MLQTLKNALGLNKSSAKEGMTSAMPSTIALNSSYNKVSEWAQQQGMTTAERPDGKGYQVFGKTSGKPWRIEQGRPSREFIHGLELRARGEMDLREDVSLMIMTRSLKDELEKRAFALYTDSLQTIADPSLPEEMRWLSMYEEIGWESLGAPFVENYAILANEQDNAVAWLTPALKQQLLSWPSKQPDVPRVLMIMRGKVYLRMQINAEDLATLDHATKIFNTACESAVAQFTTDVSL